MLSISGQNWLLTWWIWLVDGQTQVLLNPFHLQNTSSSGGAVLVCLHKILFDGNALRGDVDDCAVSQLMGVAPKMKP